MRTTTDPGTVGVVALAHAFAANPGASRKRSLLFIVFAAEERGLLGRVSLRAAHPLRPLATTRREINFDMIGRNEAARSARDHRNFA